MIFIKSYAPSVYQGIFSSRGEKVLFVDADGATKFSDLDNVEKGLDSLEGGKEGMAVSVGSRAHLQEQSVAEVLKDILVCFYQLHVVISGIIYYFIIIRVIIMCTHL